MKRAIIASLALLALLFAAGGGGATEAAPAKAVVLLHGWNRTANDWNTAKAQYEAAGFKVYALKLPKSGSRAGDTRKNADAVQAFITSNGLTDVMVDGHSLGGTLVYELIRVRRDARITAAVTRDSRIQASTGDTGLNCWFVPDQCEGGSQRKAILAAPLATVPILNVSASTAGQADVDCNRNKSLSHLAFLTDAQVTGWAIEWAKGNYTC